jgi:carbamoyl-phosphate synthase large subunit
MEADEGSARARAVLRLTADPSPFMAAIQVGITLVGFGASATAAVTLRAWKRMGFADSRLASLLGASEDAVRQRRQQLGVLPVYKRVDSCAAEFPAATAYLYSTYEQECEGSRPTGAR